MLKFFKMHGLGNDYIYIDERKNKPLDYVKLAKDICRPHFSIGADGIIVIKPSKRADAKIEIYNLDGSKAKMCGNASRCVAFYLFKELNKKELQIEVNHKIITAKILEHKNNLATVKIDLKKAKFLDYFTADALIKKEQEFFKVDVGNPHLVTIVDDFNFDVEEVGKNLSKAHDCNVEFAKILSKNKVKVLVYERGSGRTLACGSGASATAFCLKKLNLIESPCEIILEGGSLFIEVLQNNNVFMTGPAEFVFEGIIDL